MVHGTCNCQEYNGISDPWERKDAKVEKEREGNFRAEGGRRVNEGWSKSENRARAKIGKWVGKKGCPGSRVSRSRLGSRAATLLLDFSSKSCCVVRCFGFGCFDEGSERWVMFLGSWGSEEDLNKSCGCFEAHLEMLIRLEKPLFTSFEPRRAMCQCQLKEKKPTKSAFQFGSPQNYVLCGHKPGLRGDFHQLDLK